MINIVKSYDDFDEMEMRIGGIIPFSLYEDEFYFLMAKEGKNCKMEDRGMWGDFGGKINKDNGSNLEECVRHFWEQSNAIIGTKAGLCEYIYENFDKLLVIHSTIYEGILIFLPIDFEKKYENIFYTTSIYHKMIMDRKKEWYKFKPKNLFGKEIIKWFSIEELNKHKKKFKKSNQELTDFINDTFNY